MQIVAGGQQNGPPKVINVLIKLIEIFRPKPFKTIYT